MNRREEGQHIKSGSSFSFFDSLPELLKLDAAESLLGISRKTIYDWKYRQKQLGVPDDLFIKFNRKLYLRTESLKRWMSFQNPGL